MVFFGVGGSVGYCDCVGNGKGDEFVNEFLYEIEFFIFFGLCFLVVWVIFVFN